MEPPQPATEVEPQQPAAEVEPQPAASMMAATTAVVVAAPLTSLVLAAVGGPGAAVVEIPDDDDDVPPPGWDQWASAPVSALEASAGALVAQGGLARRRGTQWMALGPRHHAPDPQRAWSRRSRGSGRSSATTAPRSTMR
jgi:hypothetical protein